MVAVNTLAASAVSPEGLSAEKLDFQAMIEAAVSAASLDLEGGPRTTAWHADSAARQAPLQIQGGCASSRHTKATFQLLFHDFFSRGDAVLAADLITACRPLPGRLR